MKVFCLGNGPSLRYQRLGEGEPNHERLKREVTIGVNWIPLLFDPDYLIWTDSLEYLGYGTVEKSKAVKYCWDHLRNAPVEIDARRFGFYVTKEDILLSEYVEDGLMRNGSCIYSAINLAYIMGGDPIFLLGTDFSSRDGYLHFYDDEPSEQAFEESRAPQDRATLDYMERLGDRMSELGVTIYNATEGGLLRSFPTCTLAEALDMPDPVGADILYEPDFSLLSPELQVLRKVHERNKRRLREEVADLWTRKQE